MPRPLLRSLLADVKTEFPDFLALAWTPGLEWSHYRLLEGMGFDGVFSSLPWWDFRSSWIFEEYELLRHVAPVLGCPEAPFGPRLAGTLKRSDRLLYCRRSLGFAAAAFDGLLLPMSFGKASSNSPSDPTRLGVDFVDDLSTEILAANRFQADISDLEAAGEIRVLTAPDAPVTAVVKFSRRDARRRGHGFAIAVNPSLDRETTLDVPLDPLPACAGAPLAAAQPAQQVKLAPAEVRVIEVEQTPFVRSRAGEDGKALKLALRAPRIAVEHIRPSIDEGRFAVKRLAGESVEVTADVFSDGHGILAADLVWKAGDEREWHRAPMTMGHNDVWRASFTPQRVGRYKFTIEGWFDTYATLCHAMAAKRKAAVDFAQEREEALAAVDQALEGAEGPVRTELAAIRADGHVDALLATRTQALMRMLAGRPFLYRHEPAVPVEVERPQAGIGAWYEMFPRSASPVPGRHGTFNDVIDRLPAIRAMGFDVLYFPPIHPIGTTHRKGRNNALTAGPDDPGSCYAIGGAAGGHDAILPELGTFDDFKRLQEAAAREGLEIALDFAIQCSPDHPWLREHPEWFRWQKDGSIRYAENPPKKY
ncbi:MAG: DUF3416 domain-containing protein, partial [Xanthobacteraceae bacterium]|nr:DUF3416 domain-containing protein [Xanthobacteraceae bacterium]